jgi:protein-S-isoprenylcysteine O-methyltransferase Ste14
MTNKTKGYLLVAGQFILLIALFVIPNNKDILVITPWLPQLSFIFLIPGVFILLLSFLGLGSSLTANPVPKDNSQLVTDGLYKLVRHPIYTGLLLLGLSLVLNAGIFPHVLVWLVLAVLLNYKAKFEESLLMKRYPEYVEYASKTGRFIPRLKR